MRKFKAIKIDAENKQITEIEVTDGLQSYYDAIGCDLITTATYIGNDCVYVDDEGLLKQPTDDEGNRISVKGFEINGYPQKLAGSGVVVGTTPGGDSTTPNLTVDVVKRLVTFCEITPAEVDAILGAVRVWSW